MGEKSMWGAAADGGIIAEASLLRGERRGAREMYSCESFAGCPVPQEIAWLFVPKGWAGGCQGGEMPKKEFSILYTNHRGETATRRIVPERVWFGSTRWHPEPQWLLDAKDIDRRDRRSFALRDILSWASAEPASRKTGQ